MPHYANLTKIFLMIEKHTKHANTHIHWGKQGKISGAW